VTEIDDAAAMGRALAYYRANLRPWDLGRFKAGRITQPGLVVHGSRDPAIGDYLMRATAEQFEDLRGFHALDCGHFIQRLRTEELNDVLLGFLGSVA
jgi:pimeloyl-ACP methyl ester carboxylesterase